MQYFGGKQRISKYIIEFLNNNLNDSKYFFEPFVGGANIVPFINLEKKYASDKNEYLIEMYIALQSGWIPPQNVSEEEYQSIKKNKDENKALTSFAGFGCSFAGKWFGGYARNKIKHNYIKFFVNTTQSYGECYVKYEYLKKVDKIRLFV